MAARLAGKTAFITAAGQGIGKASVLAYAAEGATVWASDIDESLLEAFRGDPRIITRRLDVLDAAAIDALANEIGAVDVLFNCAGYVHHGALLDTAIADWDFSFALNVRAMFMTTRAFLPAMLAAGGASIINMASVASTLRGVPNRCAYGASKAAVMGLTRSIAADYVGKRIRCNALCPGTVDTPSLAGRIGAFADAEKARRDFLARQPMGRFATPDEIALLAVYLGCDESTFVTGQFFAIDGGMTV